MKTPETGLYVLEWSQKHGSTHVQPLEKTLSANRAAYRDDQPVNDYVPIAVGTQDDMLAASQAMRPALIGRAFEFKEAA